MQLAISVVAALVEMGGMNAQWEIPSGPPLCEDFIGGFRTHAEQSNWDGWNVMRIGYAAAECTSLCNRRVIQNRTSTCHVFLRKALNRWTTELRFQHSNCCVLNCGGEDSIAHHTNRRVYRRFCARHLNQAIPEPSFRLFWRIVLM